MNPPDWPRHRCRGLREFCRTKAAEWRKYSQTGRVPSEPDKPDSPISKKQSKGRSQKASILLNRLPGSKFLLKTSHAAAGSYRSQDPRHPSGRCSLAVAEVAARVGLSQTPCWRRIQRLRADGIIERTVAFVHPEAVGLGLTVFITIEALDHSPEWLERFTAVVSSSPEVMEVHRMAGDTDYLLRVAVADMAAFDAFYATSSRRSRSRTSRRTSQSSG